MGDVRPLAIPFLAEGKVDMRSIVTHRVGLEEAPACWRLRPKTRPATAEVLIDLKRP